MPRVCGKTCHDAKGPTCRCWCGGTFHGAAGREARSEFTAALILEKMPSTEEMFKRLTQPRLFDGAAAWRDRVEAAVAAREAK